MVLGFFSIFGMEASPFMDKIMGIVMIAAIPFFPWLINSVLYDRIAKKSTDPDQYVRVATITFVAVFVLTLIIMI